MTENDGAEARGRRNGKKKQKAQLKSKKKSKFTVAKFLIEEIQNQVRFLILFVRREPNSDSTKDVGAEARGRRNGIKQKAQLKSKKKSKFTVAKFLI